MKRIIELAWLIAVVALVAAAVFGPGMVLGSQPVELAVVERVDRMVLNHFYDERGKLVFDQIIFFDWVPDGKIYLVENGHYQTTWEGGGFEWQYIGEVYHSMWKPGTVYVPGEREETHPWRCIAFRLVKNPNQLPYKVHATGEYHAVWMDGEILRKVAAKQFEETWTQYDEEIWERAFLPQENRRELRKIPELKRGPLRPNAAEQVENQP